MLNKIIRYSLNNRLLILVASVLLLFAGLYTSMKMDVDVFPDLNAPTVVVRGGGTVGDLPRRNRIERSDRCA